MMLEVGDAVRAELAEMRSTLDVEFGHAVLDVAVGVEPRRHEVSLVGRVASAVTAARVVTAASAAAPGWRVDGRGLDELRTGDWWTLPAGVTAVSVSRFGRALTSELVEGDGPVEVLAQVGTSTFIRTGCGTLGWVRRPLGQRTAAPASTRPVRLATLKSVTAAWLGTPYRLGGTTPSGIDCSGLLLRCLAATWGVRLPRHSTDQIPDDVVSHHDRVEPGDAVILRDRVGRSHVGLVVGLTRAGPIVVHASTTRGRVVAEPLDRLAAEFVDLAVAPLSTLLETHSYPA